MIKKDFIAIANCIKEYKNDKSPAPADIGYFITQYLVRVLRASSNNFNEASFIDYITNTDKHIKSYY